MAPGNQADPQKQNVNKAGVQELQELENGNSHSEKYSAKSRVVS